MIESQRKRILGLNGIRAIAILLVFQQHKATWAAVDSGRMGVWLFFGLSGYLIIGILNRQRLICESDDVSFGYALKRFFYRRTLRIFPIYYLVLALCAIALLAANHYHDERLSEKFVDGWVGLFYHAIYVSNLWMGLKLHEFAGSLGHLWSLSVEEQFYLICAPALLFSAASKHVRIIFWSFLVCLLCQIILRLVDGDSVFTYTFSLNNFAVMLCGGVCYFIGERREISRNSRLSWWLPLFVLLVAYFRFLIFSHDVPSSINAILDVGMIVSIGFLILWIDENQSSFIVSVLEWAPLEYLGRISYGFYLYHNFIPNIGAGGPIVTMLGLKNGSPSLRVFGVVLGFLLAVLVAHLSWRYIERPLLSLKRRVPERPVT